MANKNQLKLIIAVTLIVMIGGLMGVVGYLVENKKNVIKKQTTITETNILNSDHKIEKLEDSQISNLKIVQLKNSTVDISEFIGNESAVFKTHTEDINNDGIEEIFIYYMQDRKSGISKGDKDKFLMILKNNSENNYEINWKYFVGDGSYKPQEKLIDWVTFYDDEVDKIKIKFTIDYRPMANEPYEYRFVSFDKNENKFELIKISNTDFYMDDLNMMRKAITVEDIDNDGIQEIIENDENEFGYKYVYNWDEKTCTYQANTYLSKDRFKLDDSEKIYTNEEYGYEFKYVAYLGVPYEEGEGIYLSYGHGSITIRVPIEIEQKEVDSYKCVDGEKTKTKHFLRGNPVYKTCSVIESENELEIFKSSHRGPMDSYATYNLIKENNDGTFTIIVISTTNMSADKITSSFKFIK
ncbi:hypothetical protein KAS41_01465 [Candidatus Parcubacteria bacterium]|nr:hypothetical protein [Candidatus Parcubacteria bacterium]